MPHCLGKGWTAFLMLGTRSGGLGVEPPSTGWSRVRVSVIKVLDAVQPKKKTVQNNISRTDQVPICKGGACNPWQQRVQIHISYEALQSIDAPQKHMSTEIDMQHDMHERLLPALWASLNLETHQPRCIHLQVLLFLVVSRRQKSASTWRLKLLRLQEAATVVVILTFPRGH